MGASHRARAVGVARRSTARPLAPPSFPRRATTVLFHARPIDAPSSRHPSSPAPPPPPPHRSGILASPASLAPLRARAAPASRARRPARLARGLPSAVSARGDAAADSSDSSSSSGKVRRVAAASLASLALFASSPDASLAELNAREAARGGEFNRGSAQQFGGYDLTNEDVVGKYGKDLRLSNFTGAEMRRAKLRGANLTGAYLMKAVAFAADFEGANLSDALMDRAVLNDANFKDAVMTRVVLTSSDLGDAVIEGADFSDALIDEKQRQALCKYASGTNPETGVSTRRSLNCGGSGRTSSPSRYMTDDTAKKPEAAFEASRFSMMN